MNWFKNIVPPGIKKIFKKREVPDNLWLKCPACDSMIFHTDAEESLFVCPECDFHLKVSAETRFSQLFDRIISTFFIFNWTFVNQIFVAQKKS